MKFKKKPVVVEAEQWFAVGYTIETELGSDKSSLPLYNLNVGFYRTPELDGRIKCKHCGIIMHDHGWIDTLEGGHIVCPKDWIITGVKGEQYPCKPDIFEETYEKVEE